jgi:xyloglucan fucosyltransferase
MGNIKDYYNSGASSSPCKFLIMEISGVGVGNKISLLISGMLYAIMTQRVILLNTWSYIPWTFCEPFLGSSWVNDDHFPLPQRHGPESTMLGKFAGWEAPVWKSSTHFARGIDAILAGEDASLPSKVKVEFSDPEVKRFFCDTEQAFLSEATWVHFTGCLYFLPKLFAVPAFRPALEALFPDPSLTLTYLLRSLMLPNNAVWQQVKHHDNVLFAGVDRRVGIQVRFLYGRKVYFESASKRVNKHVKQCLIENDILSRPGGESTTRVLVTSLHRALADELRKMYENSPSVKVSQLTHREKQRFGTDDDHKAMVEILLLSFVDELLVTPLSTFGGLAQAYGAIMPWFVEVKRNHRGSCVRAQTVDLCYQTANWWYDCPHEPSVHRHKIPDAVPCLRRCLPIEESDGLQLVSPA